MCSVRVGSFSSLDILLRSVCMSEVTVVINVDWQIQPPLPSHLSMMGLRLPQFWPVEGKQKSWSKTPGATFSERQVRPEVPASFALLLVICLERGPAAILYPGAPRPHMSDAGTQR